jgi:histidinol dehydrogenase
LPGRTILANNGNGALFQPMSVDEFVKRSCYVFYTEKALGKVKDHIIKLAEVKSSVPTQRALPYVLKRRKSNEQFF